MKMKTSELTGAALDWAVARCEGLTLDFHHSTNWAQGGPIIEREGIDLASPSPIAPEWCAMFWRSSNKQSGPTPLIAAMRCYVASKLGDEVDVTDYTTGESK